jgi:hypothetical protein
MARMHGHNSPDVEVILGEITEPRPFFLTEPSWFTIAFDPEDEIPPPPSWDSFLPGALLPSS